MTLHHSSVCGQCSVTSYITLLTYIIGCSLDAISLVTLLAPSAICLHHLFAHSVLYILRTHIIASSGIGLSIAVICVTKSRTGNYDFRACACARGFPGSTVFGRTHTLRLCTERSRDNNLRFLRQFHPDKIWNTLITITYLHR